MLVVVGFIVAMYIGVALIEGPMDFIDWWRWKHPKLNYRKR